jgi:ketosteroid isomerase-like protein
VSIDENKKLVRRCLECFATGDYDGFLSCLSDDESFSWSVPGQSPHRVTHTKEQYAALIKQNHARLCPNGLSFEIVGMTAEGDRVAVELVGDHELPDGVRYRNEWHVLFELQNGKIHTVRDYHCTFHVVEVFGTPDAPRYSP